MRSIIDAEARQCYNSQEVRKTSEYKLASQAKIIDADEEQSRKVERHYHVFPKVIIA